MWTDISDQMNFSTFSFINSHFDIKKLNLLLHDAGVQFRQSGRWFLYARFAEQGYTQSKTHEYDEGKTRTHMYWTQKGRLFVYDLLKNQFGLLPVIEQDGGAA